MALAIFDLDDTLLLGDSDFLWGEFLVETGKVDADEFRKTNDKFAAAYHSGTLDIIAYQKFVLEPLMKESMETLSVWLEEYIDGYIKPLYSHKAQALVDKHRDRGDRLLIITSTSSFITNPIGELYGISELLGVDYVIEDNRYTGEILGTPTFREGKVTRLYEWMEQEGESLEGSYFYSDSHNDLPLLKIVEHPIIVDGDKALLEYGEAMGWESISVR